MCARQSSIPHKQDRFSTWEEAVTAPYLDENTRASPHAPGEYEHPDHNRPLSRCTVRSQLALLNLTSVTLALSSGSTRKWQREYARDTEINDPGLSGLILIIQSSAYYVADNCSKSWDYYKQWN